MSTWYFLEIFSSHSIGILLFFTKSYGDEEERVYFEKEFFCLNLLKIKDLDLDGIELLFR